VEKVEHEQEQDDVENGAQEAVNAAKKKKQVFRVSRILGVLNTRLGGSSAWRM
jgi:hypothetical protein